MHRVQVIFFSFPRIPQGCPDNTLLLALIGAGERDDPWWSWRGGCPTGNGQNVAQGHHNAEVPTGFSILSMIICSGPSPETEKHPRPSLRGSKTSSPDRVCQGHSPARFSIPLIVVSTCLDRKPSWIVTPEGRVWTSLDSKLKSELLFFFSIELDLSHFVHRSSTRAFSQSEVCWRVWDCPPATLTRYTVSPCACLCVCL